MRIFPSGIQRRVEAQDRYAEWKNSLRGAIIALITELKRDGTTGMGADNLKALIFNRIPRGAPQGTNAKWVISQDIDQVLRELPNRHKGFVLPDEVVPCHGPVLEPVVLRGVRPAVRLGGGYLLHPVEGRSGRAPVSP